MDGPTAGEIRLLQVRPVKKAASRAHRRAMTLLEVAVGLLLLATLLVGILRAFGQHSRQARHARIRLEAVAVADALLAEWFSRGGEVPGDDEGEVPGHPEYYWRLTPLEEICDEELDLGAVRVDLFFLGEKAGRSGEEDKKKLPFDSPIVSVELAVPLSRR
ncbi:MAG TPA: hypothetical protein DD670_09710 [Planctomycetaceae bacterium]|nr:hypothetical protein [Planctomycetaceae bacterium]